jgi:hypothetical protein
VSGDRRATSKAVELGIDELVPRIPASSGALIRDRKGRLLILKPTYKSGWTIPGGIVEADGETPWEAMTLDMYADLFDDDLEAVAEKLDVLREAARVARSLHDRAPTSDSIGRASDAGPEIRGL